MSIKSLLIEEVNSEIKEIGRLEVGSEQHKIAVDSVTKLADRILELEKFERECINNDQNREEDIDLKRQQLENEKRDQLIKNCITVGVAVAQLTVAGAAFVMSMNFEREGTLTTEGGRSSLRQLLRFRT